MTTGIATRGGPVFKDGALDFPLMGNPLQANFNYQGTVPSVTLASVWATITFS